MKKSRDIVIFKHKSINLTFPIQLIWKKAQDLINKKMYKRNYQ